MRVQLERNRGLGVAVAKLYTYQICFSLGKVAQLLDQAGVFVVITPLLETTPPEKKGIAVSEADIDLLRERFDQIAWYEANMLGYFVGGRHQL